MYQTNESIYYIISKKQIKTVKACILKTISDYSFETHESLIHLLVYFLL